jgi:hypothetical protein
MELSRYKLMLIIAIGLIGGTLKAQDEMFIYGKIKTEDGKVYEGPIRWGKEEAYWVDLFNAAKLKNENLRYLSDLERDELDDRTNSEWFSWNNNSNWFGSNRWTRWSSGDNDYVHQFACQFGDIKKMRPTGSKYVELEMRNGEKFEVSGEGYNDIGLDIKVTDTELGEMELYWGRIEEIEFMNTPSKLTTKFGTPLYGTVEAFGEKFTGYIQWDHDERLSVDKLDGDSEDGDVSIAFDKIRSIERRGGRSFVTLKSGRELYLSGSNDVSSGNRGVIIMNQEFPSVDVPWDEFDKVVFEDKPATTLAPYSQFAIQKELTGKVTTMTGETLTGRIVFDLDEEFDFELLQGKDADFEFTTPLRNVKRIVTKGRSRCSVELKSGKTFMLDDAQDVNERNQGILVFEGKTDPKYVAWHNVQEVEFK